MNNFRRTATLTGILFIIGTAAGVLSGTVTQPLLQGADALQAITAHENQWLLGTLLILVMGLPLAMVPAVLFPILKKENEVLAIGAMLFRGVLEAICYLLLVLSMLLLLSAGQAASTAMPAEMGAYRQMGALLLAAGDWLELLTAVVFSIGSLMLNLLFYRMRIIPRWLSGWGLIGSVMYFATPMVSMFSAGHPAMSLDNPMGFLLGPLAIEEMVFAVWVIVKGFNPIEAKAEAA
jgi:hypothetical protein